MDNLEINNNNKETQTVKHKNVLNIVTLVLSIIAIVLSTFSIGYSIVNHNGRDHKNVAMHNEMNRDKKHSKHSKHRRNDNSSNNKSKIFMQNNNTGRFRGDESPNNRINNEGQSRNNNSIAHNSSRPNFSEFRSEQENKPEFNRENSSSIDNQKRDNMSNNIDSKSERPKFDGKQQTDNSW